MNTKFFLLLYPPLFWILMLAFNILEYGNYLNLYFFIITLLLVILSSYNLIKIYGLKNIHGRTFFYITIAFIIGFIGMLMWQFPIFNKFTANFDIANYLMLAGYLFYFIGLINEIKFARLKFKIFKKLLIIAVILILFAIIFYFNLYSNFKAGVLQAVVINFLYNFFNILFIIATIFLLLITFEYKGGKLFTPWLMVFLGTFFNFAADFLYSFFSQGYDAGTYPHKLIDLLWLTDYLLVGAAFFQMALILKEMNDRLKTELIK